MRADRTDPRPRTFADLERRHQHRRQHEAAAQPGGKASGGERSDLYAPATDHALKVAAWREHRIAADCSTGLSATARALDYPPGYFVAVELGFAHEHRPSLRETQQGLKSAEECAARVSVAQERSRRPKLTGKAAQRALRAKVRAARVGA